MALTSAEKTAKRSSVRAPNETLLESDSEDEDSEDEDGDDAVDTGEAIKVRRGKEGADGAVIVEKGEAILDFLDASGNSSTAFVGETRKSSKGEGRKRRRSGFEVDEKTGKWVVPMESGQQKQQPKDGEMEVESGDMGLFADAVEQKQALLSGNKGYVSARANILCVQVHTKDFVHCVRIRVCPLRVSDGVLVLVIMPKRRRKGAHQSGDEKEKKVQICIFVLFQRWLQM